MKTYTLDEVQDELIGKIGTPERDRFEKELNEEILATMIKTKRKEKGLTQQAFGELAGVNKSEISKLENHVEDATFGAFLKVVRALKLKAEISFGEDNSFQIA